MENDRAGTPYAVSQIGLPVFVPERTGVFPVPHFLYAVERGPRAFRCGGAGHEEAFIRRAEIDIKETVMIADAGRPGAPGITLVGFPAGIVKTGIQVGEVLPIHQILGLQDLHAQKMEIGCHHIVGIPYPDSVRIREIGIQDGIDIRSVALVTPSLLPGRHHGGLPLDARGGQKGQADKQG